MPEQCPRDRCAWTSPDGKCHWPTYNCPWKEEKERAAERVRLIEKATAEARAKERKRREEEQERTKGLREVISGSWEARISYKRAMYTIGIYRNQEDAIAARKQAEQHREKGDLLQWLNSRKKRD